MTNETTKAMARIAAALALCLTASLQVRQPAGAQSIGLMADGFVVALDGGTASTAEAQSDAVIRSDIERILGPGWTAGPIENGRFTVAKGRSGSSQESLAATPVAPVSAGIAWERAHEVSRTRGVRYAEPTFTVDSNHGEGGAPDRFCPPCEPEKEKVSSCHASVPEALLNPEWSLDATHGANIRAAWKMFEQFGVEPGLGVVIGHPDTGYRRHPEIWPRKSSTSGVFPEFGWDFIAGKGWSPDEPDSGPFDRIPTGFLRNPGHGTKTSSVIVSPVGSQFANGSPRWVSGVAYGAMVMPLRVAEGVVLFADDIGQLQVNVSRLADAIRSAAGPNRQKAKRRADVISISMGGLPASRDLAEAIDYADREGVIVVAAAGNKVPGHKVVFPAAFKSVVAVAASNYNSEPWDCSSQGSKVAITAPGESVWTAQSRPGQDCLHASDGTSFATAMTAASAALWLSFAEPNHKAAVNALRESRQLPEAFRQALARSYRAVPWSSKGYGSGILDAAKLIADDGHVDGRTREAATSSGWCPGADSSAFNALEAIFVDSAEGQRRVERFLATGDVCTIPELADELAFWYSVDERVASAFLKITGATSPRESDYAAVRQALGRVDSSASLKRAVGR